MSDTPRTDAVPDITHEQREAIRAFVASAISPLIEAVIVKKLGQAIAFCQSELQNEKEPHP